MATAFDYQGAKKAGYTDDEIMDHLSSRYPDYDIKSAKKSGYSPKEINQYLANYQPQAKGPATSDTPKTSEEPEENLTRAISQVPQGLLESTPAGLGASAFGLAGMGESLAELEELEERLPDLKKKFPQLPWPEKIDREKYMRSLEEAVGAVPTVANIATGVEKRTGIPLEPKTKLDKMVRFISSLGGFKAGNLQEKIMAGLKAQAMKGALEETGIPEPVSEAMAIYYGLHEKSPDVRIHPPEEKIPLAAEEGKLPGKPQEEPSLPPPSASRNVLSEPSEIKRMPSGLTEPRAVEADETLSKFATISPTRQKHAIEKLNKEASELTKKTVEKHLPIAKQIEQGFDFEHQFEKGFAEVKALAKKYNPEINIKPINQFLRETAAEYKNIPTPDPEAKKIINEIKNFRKNEQTAMNDLLKIYRSNNKKLRQISEMARVKGKQYEYRKFLEDMNRAIASSFKGTFPEDSAWIKMFEENNKIYRDYIRAKETINKLKPLLQGEITPAKLSKMATDPVIHKRLELSMGKDGAAEIRQIAQDLKKATDSLRKIPASELKLWDAVFPVGIFIPFVKIPAAAVTAIKAAKGIRMLYGYWLSTPARREAFDSALKAIEHRNLQEYKKAIDGIKKELPEDLKLLTYQPSEQK